MQQAEGAESPDIDLRPAMEPTPGSPLPQLGASQSLSSLPSHIKPINQRMGSDDVAYLRSKRALELPSLNLRNALLRALFDYVFPYLPIFDLDAFLQSVSTHDGSSGQVSLLLVQAVMAAGSAHVDFIHLKEAGYQTRTQARLEFLNKVRVSNVLPSNSHYS